VMYLAFRGLQDFQRGQCAVGCTLTHTLVTIHSGSLTLPEDWKDLGTIWLMHWNSVNVPQIHAR
jgi:hypothetical protein